MQGLSPDMSINPSPAEGDRKHRRHVWIDDDQWDWLGERFEGNIGRSKAIRMIIEKFRKTIEAKAAQSARPAQELSIEVGET